MPSSYQVHKCYPTTRLSLSVLKLKPAAAAALMLLHASAGNCSNGWQGPRSQKTRRRERVGERPAVRARACPVGESQRGAGTAHVLAEGARKVTSRLSSLPQLLDDLPSSQAGRRRCLSGSLWAAANPTLAAVLAKPREARRAPAALPPTPYSQLLEDSCKLSGQLLPWLPQLLDAFCEAPS